MRGNKIFILEDKNTNSKYSNSNSKFYSNRAIEAFEGVKPESNVNYMTPFKHPPIDTLDLVQKNKPQGVFVGIVVLLSILGFIVLICCLIFGV